MPRNGRLIACSSTNSAIGIQESISVAHSEYRYIRAGRRRDAISCFIDLKNSGEDTAWLSRSRSFELEDLRDGTRYASTHFSLYSRAEIGNWVDTLAIPPHFYSQIIVWFETPRVQRKDTGCCFRLTVTNEAKRRVLDITLRKPKPLDGQYFKSAGQ